jgi:3-mercaptopropionate dioxygenase
MVSAVSGVSAENGTVTARCPAALLEGIRAATRTREGWDETAAFVAAALGRHMPSPDILSASERAGLPDRYAQHILHTEPDGSFSVVGVVWRPGQVTPIHDHVTWCVVGVIAGAEHEELFERRNGDADGHLVQVASRENMTGSVTGFAPPGDIHRVRNTGHGVAISIHVYGADISRLGTSVRHIYDLPVAADISPASTR